MGDWRHVPIGEENWASSSSVSSQMKDVCPPSSGPALLDGGRDRWCHRSPCGPRYVEEAVEVVEQTRSILSCHEISSKLPLVLRNV